MIGASIGDEVSYEAPAGTFLSRSKQSAPTRDSYPQAGSPFEGVPVRLRLRRPRQLARDLLAARAGTTRKSPTISRRTVRSGRRWPRLPRVTRPTSSSS